MASDSSDFWGKGDADAFSVPKSPMLKAQSTTVQAHLPAFQPPISESKMDTYAEFSEWLYDQQEFKYFIGRLRHHGLLGSIKYMWRCAMRARNQGVMGTVYNNDRQLMSFVKQHAPKTAKLTQKLSMEHKYWFRIAVIDYLLSDVPIWMINWGKSDDGRTFQVSFFPEVEMRS